MGTNAKTVSIPLDKIVWRIQALPEVVSPEDAFEDERDIAMAQQAQKEDDIWGYCCVKVTGTYCGFVADTYLGCCTYESEEDFKQSGGYYDDMRQEIADELSKEVGALLARLEDDGILPT